MKLYAHGRSSCTGFKLNVTIKKTKYTDRKILSKGSTREYNSNVPLKDIIEPKKILPTSLMLITTILVLVLFLKIITVYTAPEKIGAIIFGSIGFLMLRKHTPVICAMFSFSKKLKHWHGCEHKLALLYEKNIARTKENLIRARRENIHCGVTSTLLPIFLSITFIIYSLLIDYLISLFYILSLALIMYVFSLITSLLLQKFFTTAEPGEKEIEHALELAKKLDAQLLEKQALT